MIIGFGRHRGESAESVVLLHPGYVLWALAQDAESGPLAQLAGEFRRLIEQFDNLPFVAHCREEGCDRTATCCTLHRRAVVPYFWCEVCDPTAGRNPAAKLLRVETYFEACSYAAMYCNGRRVDAARLIRSMAQAKGLPERVGKREAVAFFE